MLAGDRKYYWETVRQCLNQLHGVTLTRALSLIRDYRNLLRAEDIENAIYHDEPYDVACEIAGVEGEYQVLWAKYQKIRAEYFPMAQNVVALSSRRRKTQPKSPSTRVRSKAQRPPSVAPDDLRATRTEGKRPARKMSSGHKTTSRKTSLKRIGAKKPASSKPIARKATGKTSKKRRR